MLDEQLRKAGISRLRKQLKQDGYGELAAPVKAALAERDQILAKTKDLSVRVQQELHARASQDAT